jgi:hypothetical protein
MSMELLHVCRSHLPELGATDCDLLIADTEVLLPIPNGRVDALTARYVVITSQTGRRVGRQIRESFQHE